MSDPVLRPPARRTLWWRLALGATAVVAVLAVRSACFSGRAFDPVAWQDATQIQNGARLDMADRLVAHDALIGKTRSAVAEMLGNPPATAYFAKWDLVYFLGPERGLMSIDSEWLVLRLDDNGRVVEARILHD